MFGGSKEGPQEDTCHVHNFTQKFWSVHNFIQKKTLRNVTKNLNQKACIKTYKLFYNLKSMAGRLSVECENFRKIKTVEYSVQKKST